MEVEVANAVEVESIIELSIIELSIIELLSAIQPELPQSAIEVLSAIADEDEDEEPQSPELQDDVEFIEDATEPQSPDEQEELPEEPDIGWLPELE